MGPWSQRMREAAERSGRRIAKEKGLTICQHRYSYSYFCNDECRDKEWLEKPWSPSDK